MKPILRKIDTSYNYSFSVREDIGPYLYNHWHFHPETELTLIKKGVGMRLVGDNMEPFTDGDLILLGSNLPHLWRSDPEYFQGDTTLGVEAIAIHFMENFWGDIFLNMPEMHPIRGLLSRAQRGIRVTGATKDKITDMMERMLDTAGAGRIILLLNILNLLSGSNEYRLLSSSGFTTIYDRSHTDNINLIYNYTLENFREKICIRELAAIANVSPHSFCRYFKSRTMKRYWQFLLEVRIGYACKLLMENKISISQVCYSCGFNNLSNFNRQFKVTTGLTPSAYLKEHSKIIKTISAFPG